MDAAPTVAEVGEAGLLSRLQRWLALEEGDLLAAAGDDAAVWLPPLGQAVATTTDSLVEGVHFRAPLTTMTATDLGWRLLAISLSDLAAMGASAGPAFISLAIPGSWPVGWVEAVYQGLAECAAHAGAKLAGGNISQSATAVLTSTCVGAVAAEALLRRTGARSGWELAVTGPLGAAAAALRLGDSTPWPTAARPAPRLEAGRLLAQRGVRVAMDVSDGLFIDAARLLDGAECSGLVIDAEAIPVAEGIRDRWPGHVLDVAAGGEDYELLFAGPTALVRSTIGALRQAGLEPAVIGGFDDGAGLRLSQGGKEVAPPTTGHRHFGA